MTLFIFQKRLKNKNMGVSDGPKGPIDLTNEDHRRWVRQLFCNEYNKRELYEKVREYIDCDLLFDRPTKKTAARLFIWWAATKSPQIHMNDMFWFRRYMHFAEYEMWTEADGYGDGIKYAKELAKLMKLPVSTKKSDKKNKRNCD